MHIEQVTIYLNFIWIKCKNSQNITFDSIHYEVTVPVAVELKWDTVYFI